MGKSADLFKKTIEKALEKRGAKADLSKKTGIQAPHIHKYLNGSNVPGLDVLDRFAEGLGCSSWELIKPENDLSTVERLTNQLQAHIRREKELLEQLGVIAGLQASEDGRELLAALSSLNDPKLLASVVALIQSAIRGYQAAAKDARGGSQKPGKIG